MVGVGLYRDVVYSHNKYQPRHKLSVNCEQDCGLASSATQTDSKPVRHHSSDVSLQFAHVTVINISYKNGYDYHLFHTNSVVVSSEVSISPQLKSKIN